MQLSPHIRSRQAATIDDGARPALCTPRPTHHPATRSSSFAATSTAASSPRARTPLRNEEPEQDLGGIGINTIAEPRGLRVVNVIERSPAVEAGLMYGVLIVKVGSVSLADRAGDLGTELIRGPVGTPVELTFLQDDAQHVIWVERAKIVAPVATLRLLTHHDLRIGHLTLTGFSEGSGDKLRTEVRSALDEGAQALILDLRETAGPDQ